jgi:5'-nucleotidase
MFKPPLDLKGKRVLVTNDDGVYAPGIKVLARIARSMGAEVWTVAPQVEQSAASHSLTLRRPLRLIRLAPRRYAVDGTPPDCMVLALNLLLAEHPPVLVLSGINMGANLGEDVVYSGTIAAAREATILGVPAIAFSQVMGPSRKPHWATADHYGATIIRKLLKTGWPSDVCISVNFPDLRPKSVKGVEVAIQGRRRSGVRVLDAKDPAGRAYYWIGDFETDEARREDSDLAAIRRAAISITPLDIDTTHRRSLASLRKAFR